MATRRVDQDVLDVIEEMAVRGSTPSQITRALARGHMAKRAPTLRTVQRIVAERIVADDSAPWTLTPDESDPATIAWVLAASLRDGWRLPITTAEARWIVTVHRMVPDVGPLTTRRLARLYMAGQGEWLTPALALAPWRTKKDRLLDLGLLAGRLHFAMTPEQVAR